MRISGIFLHPAEKITASRTSTFELLLMPPRRLYTLEWPTVNAIRIVSFMLVNNPAFCVYTYCRLQWEVRADVSHLCALISNQRVICTAASISLTGDFSADDPLIRNECTKMLRRCCTTILSYDHTFVIRRCLSVYVLPSWREPVWVVLMPGSNRLVFLVPTGLPSRNCTRTGLSVHCSAFCLF